MITVVASRSVIPTKPLDRLCRSDDAWRDLLFGSPTINLLNRLKLALGPRMPAQRASSRGRQKGRARPALSRMAKARPSFTCINNRYCTVSVNVVVFCSGDVPLVVALTVTV